LRTGDLNFWPRHARGGDRGDNNFATPSTITSFGLLLFACAMLIPTLVNIDAARAQSAGILAPGNAVVTGFSGAPPPAQIAPGADPGDQTYIDPGGPSAQVFDLQSPGAPPQAQVLAEPNPFTVTAAQVGQVFAVTLDNATPPNMYVAATSAYGLPIVVPGLGGAPMRVRQGAPGASFMAGLFGPATQRGGPGSIWRIDGISGAVTLFANVTTNGVGNSGPALGGLAFDAASNSLFVADRETGIIHRFDLSGKEIGSYDHGTQSLAAAGQPPVPYAPSPLDITSPQFSSDNPATWHYAPAPRLIFGLAVHVGRLYYAVAAGLEVWSVGIEPDGSFGGDARMELQVPPGLGPTEISKIVFDDSGDMILAERAAPTGDYELMQLAQPGIGRVLRYAPVPAAPDAPAWQPVPDQYAIGFPGQMTNGNGGAAIGYGYDPNGNLDRGSCGGFLWSTGEQLRNAADSRLANVLAANGALDLNGMQGNAIDLVEPANVPPLLTYFVDYDVQLDDPAARGRMGDIAIPRTCGQAALEGILIPGLAFVLPPWLPPGWFSPPPIPPGSYCPANQMTPTGQCCPPWQHVVNGACSCPGGLPPAANGQCACPTGTSPQPGFQCCPFGTMPNSGGQCKPVCPNGATDPKSVALCLFGFDPVPVGGIYDCLNGTQPPQQKLTACIGQSPLANAQTCPDGWTKVNDPKLGVTICEPTPQQKICAAQGMNVGLNGTCQKVCAPGNFPFPTTQCCTNGETPLPNGVCCPSGAVPNPYTGQCCPPGSHINSDGQCVQLPPNCPPGQMTVTGICCPIGEKPQPDGSCRRPPPPPTNSCQQSGGTLDCEPLKNVLCKLGHEVPGGCCPTGSMPTASGTCVAIGPSCGTDPSLCCPGGQTPNFVTGQCCPAGVTPLGGKNGPVCQSPPPPPPPPGTGNMCPAGYVKLVTGACCLESQKTSTGQCCPLGEAPAADGACQPVIRILGCPRNEVYDPHNRICGPPPLCPPGTTRNTAAGLCSCPAGQSLNSDGKCVAATCLNGEVRNPINGRCERKVVTTAPPPPAVTCAPGYMLGANGMCQRVTTVCPPGEVPGLDGRCFVPPPPSPPGIYIPGPPPPGINSPGACPPGEERTNRGCVPVHPACPPGEVMTPRGCERPSGPTTCPPGEVATPRGCEKPSERGCPPGKVTTPRGCEKPPERGCPRGEVMTPRGCEKPPERGCPPGEERTHRGCVKGTPKINLPSSRRRIESPPPKRFLPARHGSVRDREWGTTTRRLRSGPPFVGRCRPPGCIPPKR
jgi:hypothetical protein